MEKMLKENNSIIRIRELKKLQEKKRKKIRQHINTSFSGETISTKGNSKMRFLFGVKNL